MLGILVLGIGGLPTLTVTSAHAQSIKAQTGIAQYNLNKAMKQSCLNGFFNDINSIFGIVKDFENMLKQFDNAIKSILGPYDPNFNPLKCLPNIDLNSIIGFNPAALSQCMSLPSISCTYSTPNMNNFQQCVQNVFQFNPPNINPDQIANCLTPQLPNLQIPNLVGILNGFLGQLQNRINALLNLLNIGNLNLLKWYINFCGEVQKGNVQIQVKKISKATLKSKKK